jgi:hypothetical protein
LRLESRWSSRFFTFSSFRSFRWSQKCNFQEFQDILSTKGKICCLPMWYETTV